MFSVPGEADFLLGPPEDGTIRGLALDEEIVSRILEENVRSLYGREPKALDGKAALEECRRLASIESEVTGLPPEKTEAGQTLERLRDF